MRMGVLTADQAEVPDPVLAGDTVHQTLFDQPLKNAIQRDLVNRIVATFDGLLKLLVRYCAVSRKELLQDPYACRCGRQPAIRQQPGCLIRPGA